MKASLVLVTLAATALSGQALAQQKYGSAGCGLGSVIIGPGEGMSQTFAASSNMSYFQATAITSGTSNCVPVTQAAQMELQDSFMKNNYASLSREMAQGQGETLVGLAETLGCADEARTDFASVLQANHGRIFAAPGALAALDAAKRTLAANEATKKACSKLYI